MPTPYQLAQQFRAALLRRDADALRDITAAYDRLVTSLQLSVSALSAQATSARATGQAVNTAWLFRERRLQRLLDQAEEQLASFTAQLSIRLTSNQRAAVNVAQVHTQQILRAAGMDAEITYSRLPTAAIETLVGLSGDGAPLTKLLSTIPGDATARIRETLIASLATGLNPRQTASQLKDVLQGNLARAQTITRTETLRAYREASRQTAKAVGVERWEWVASKSQRTCLACLAMDGKIFSIEKPQPNHPNCRCTVIYLPPDYVPPPRETGAQWFAKQPDDVKRAMMSKVAFEAYQKGEIKLQDFIGIRRSKVWGETRFELSLKEIRRLQAEKAAKPKPVRKPKRKRAPVDPFPLDITALEELRTLGGSTGAKLVRDPATGKHFVLKRGANADHLREEGWADELYRAFGVNVPPHRIYDTANGSVKLSEFINGRTLNQLKGAELDAARQQLREHFAVDALMGNWDVIGLSADNVLVDTAGKVWRIDNGGSLRFRAQGARKTADQWNDYPEELWTLRDATTNAQTANVFGQLTIYDLRRQIDALSNQAIGSLSNLPKELRDVLTTRLSQMRYVGQIAQTFEDDLWKATYTDGFVRHVIGLRKAGIVEKLPNELTQDAGSVYPKDENGKLFDNLRGPGSIVEDLTTYMTRNGVEQKIIARWADEQAGDSWNDAPQAIKEFFIQQRTVDRSQYWFKPKSDTIGNYQKLLNKYDEVKVLTTWQIQHAITYELLGKTKMRYNDQVRRYLRLIRTENKAVLNAYGVNVGAGHSMPRGAHESSSLFDVTYPFGSETTIQNVPHHRITATYLFSRTTAGEDFFLGDGENEFIFLPQGIKFEYTGTRKAPNLGGGLNWKVKQ